MKNDFICTMKKNRCLLIAPLITSALLLIVYALKGVFPFGNRNISYYDMSQSLIPIYYHTYDFLHGKAGLFFNWFTGSGSTMVDTAGNFVFNPINLFFLFVKRDMILESMSFFLMIKLALCAFNMSLLAKKKWQNLNNCWVVCAGISYSSCGLVLQYYCNIHFIDIVILFPLLVLAYDQLLTRDKKISYIIILALCFITNIYLSFMICIYLILSGTLTIRFQIQSEKKKEAAWKIAICTIDALLISAVVTLPNIIALLQSSRAQKLEQGTYLSQIVKIWSYSDGQKSFMLYGSEIGIAFLLIYLFSKKNTKTQNEFYKKSIWMLLLLASPIFIEPINQLWHMGGYVQFPMRFGYMICLEIWLFSCEWIVDNKSEEKLNLRTKIAALIAPAMIPLISLIMREFFSIFLQYGIRNEYNYTAYWLLALLLIIFFLLTGIVLKNDSSKARYVYVLCIIMVILQSGIGMYGMIAPTDEASEECGDDLILKSQYIRNHFRLDQDLLTKVKDTDESLNANYGFILEEGSLANWTLGVEATTQKELELLGYSTSYTRLLDNGGTLFSDALLGINESIMSRRFNSTAFKLIENKDGLFHYQNLYAINPGICLQEEQLEELQKLSLSVSATDVNILPFSYQNAIYQILNKKKADLITIADNKRYIKNMEKDDAVGYNIFELEIPIEDATEIYLYSDVGSVFFIEDELVKLPIMSNQDNYTYPIEFRNGIIDGGSYENQAVHLKVLTSKDNLNSLQIGLMKLADMESFVKLCDSKEEKNAIKGDKIEIIKETKEGYLFLPMAYHEGYHITVNGQTVLAKPIFDNAYFAIPVENGKSEIVIQYIPKGIVPGIILSCLGAIGIILIHFVKKENNILCEISYVMLHSLFGGIIIFIYIIPLISFFLVWIKLLK